MKRHYKKNRTKNIYKIYKLSTKENKVPDQLEGLLPFPGEDESETVYYPSGGDSAGLLRDIFIDQKDPKTKRRVRRPKEKSRYEQIPLDFSSTVSDKESSFKNELGNDIKIKIKEVEDLNEHSNSSFDAVSISIEGPSSISENVVTYLEANEMVKSLSEFLNESGKLKSNLKRAEKINYFYKLSKRY